MRYQLARNDLGILVQDESISNNPANLHLIGVRVVG